MPNPPVEQIPPARFSDVAPRIARIDDDARDADGHPALGDAVWLDLEHPNADSAGFLVDSRARTRTSPAPTTPDFGPGDAPTAPQWSVGMAIAPSARTGGLRTELVAALAAHVAAHGGGHIVLWVLGAHAQDDTELAPTGLRPARDLYEMRVRLPLGLEPKWAEGIRVRPFEPGHDEAAWLVLNNRAFAGHAEQGGWTADTLARRTAEPWFDPELFLLARDRDGLVGFDWLKIHEAHEPDPRLGEIYVIGVDPRAQGLGLGRSLVIAGLAAVHARGIETGVLFCAADNANALKLYRSLGFDVHRTDRAYELEVAPA